MFKKMINNIKENWKAIDERNALMIELSEFYKLKKVYFECLSEDKLKPYVDFLREYNKLEAKVDFIEGTVVN